MKSKNTCARKTLPEIESILQSFREFLLLQVQTSKLSTETTLYELNSIPFLTLSQIPSQSSVFDARPSFVVKGKRRISGRTQTRTIALSIHSVKCFTSTAWICGISITHWSRNIEYVSAMAWPGNLEGLGKCEANVALNCQCQEYSLHFWWESRMFSPVPTFSHCTLVVQNDEWTEWVLKKWRYWLYLICRYHFLSLQTFSHTKLKPQIRASLLMVPLVLYWLYLEMLPSYNPRALNSIMRTLTGTSVDVCISWTGDKIPESFS